MKKFNFNILWIFLLALVVFMGGSALAVLIYFDAKGYLPVILQTFFNYIKFDANGVLILLWGIALPVILLAFAIFLLVRRRKAKKFRWGYEEAYKAAVKAEMEEFAARQSKLLPSRFSAMKEGEDVAEGREVNSLSELCECFRDFAASKLNLYFSIKDIRSFVASLGTSHMLILQGISGSGKTSLAYAFGEFIGNSSTVIPVQPMWKERADLLGYYNEFTKHFNETTLFRKLYEANFGNRMYVTVLDEMNIARIEYYFAEFLSLLELPKAELRNLEVVSDIWDNDPAGIKNGCIRLPENMWFVGTVNNDDSAYSISDKVYDRAMVTVLSGKAQPFRPKDGGESVSISFGQFRGMTAQAVAGYTLSEVNRAGMQALEQYLADKFRIAFGNRIRRQIGDYVAIYVACGGDETEALDDVLATKVLRKLETKDLSHFRGEPEGLRNLLDKAFGNDAMKACKRYLGEK